MGSYFCPDCGLDGEDPICAQCGHPAELLDVDPNTGKAPVEKHDKEDDMGEILSLDSLEDSELSDEE